MRQGRFPPSGKDAAVKPQSSGHRGSTAHHTMIHLLTEESGAAPQPPGKFPLGRIVATPGALAVIPHEEMHSALRRHHRGDWGDVCPQDREENERSLGDGSRLFSVFRTKAGVKFYIITEHTRDVTTCLLPDEY